MLTEDNLERLHDIAFLFGERAIEKECGDGWQEVLRELRRRGLRLPVRFRVELSTCKG
ncbi:MAG: hypothetical protein PVH68_13570 [Armatimonadota bacterium]|jgi:hypothetical protein